MAISHTDKGLFPGQRCLANQTAPLLLSLRREITTWHGNSVNMCLPVSVFSSMFLYQKILRGAKVINERIPSRL